MNGIHGRAMDAHSYSLNTSFIACHQVKKISSKKTERVRIRMAQQVQNNENPEAVLKKLGFACFCIYYLIMHRSGEWNGLREAALPHNL